MDVATFIQAVQNVHGLTALMTEHMVGIADVLTEDQRAMAVAQLATIDQQIVDALEAQTKHYEEGEEHINHELKVITRAQEASDHASDASAAESALQNL